MDDFDDFKPITEVVETSNDENTDNFENDLFGSDFSTATTTAASSKPFSSESQQQPDMSWTMDNDLTDTRMSQPNIFDGSFGDDRTSSPQTTSVDGDLFTDQLDSNELASFPTSDYPPSATELLDQSSDNRPSESSFSFDTFPNSTSLSATQDTNQFDSTENLSPIQIFNDRRQQELVEMETLEKQKIEELRQQGKKELERWYEDRRTRMEQKRHSMREEEDDSRTKALEKSDRETCDWAKVIHYLDFSQGTQLTKQKRDINRMRTVIIQAKRDKENRKAENGI